MALFSGKGLKRAQFRIWARQQDDADIKKMLKEPDVFGRVVDEVIHAHEEATQGHAGLFQDLIAWIRSDPQGFLAFVKTIIALFSL